MAEAEEAVEVEEVVVGTFEVAEEVAEVEAEVDSMDLLITLSVSDQREHVSPSRP